jgi:hypothetical protein
MGSNREVLSHALFSLNMVIADAFQPKVARTVTLTGSFVHHRSLPPNH